MSQINGVVIGLVTNVQDPNLNGRIKVHFPWLDDQHETDWIRIATMMGGNGRGSFFMPEVNDEVLVAFDHGDVRFPYVVGFMWNGQDQPPASDVRIRRIQSVDGHSISFLDATPSGGSKGAIVIQDAHGNTITMSNGKITIKGVAVLELQAPTITLNGRVVCPNPNPI
ncbi:MAG TPA: phage baseplate assembly protein V [Chthoniobacterales bacterium]|nr:phage baseplate assembly protein V [Chthoniobacterales bacterium]